MMLGKTPQEFASAAYAKAMAEAEHAVVTEQMTQQQAHDRAVAAGMAAGNAAAGVKPMDKPAASPKPTGPRLTLDPFNRLQPPSRDKPMPASLFSWGAPPPSTPTGPTMSDRGDAWRPMSTAQHALDFQAFKAQVKCLSKPDLNTVYDQLQSQIRTLMTMPANSDRNVQVSRLKMRLAIVSPLRRKPARCAGSSTLRPTTALPAASTFMYKPMPRSTTVPAPGSPGGVTVSEMPIRVTGTPGEEVIVTAPVLDLYSVYADRGMEREAGLIREETNRILREIERLESAPPPAATRPTTAIDSGAVAGGGEVPFGAETSFDFPIMSSAADASAMLLEQSEAPSGPVEMSAGAAVPEDGETNWWLLLGAGAVFFALSRAGAKGSKKKARRK